MTNEVLALSHSWLFILSRCVYVSSADCSLLIHSERTYETSFLSVSCHRERSNQTNIYYVLCCRLVSRLLGYSLWTSFFFSLLSRSHQPRPSVCCDGDARCAPSLLSSLSLSLSLYFFRFSRRCRRRRRHRRLTTHTHTTHTFHLHPLHPSLFSFFFFFFSFFLRSLFKRRNSVQNCLSFFAPDVQIRSSPAAVVVNNYFHTLNINYSQNSLK